MAENNLNTLDGLHKALSWTVPYLNQNAFVNGYTPMQLALGRQPNLPGLISDDRTGPLQLQQTEQDRLRKRLELKAKAQYACNDKQCAQAETDVKLRRASCEDLRAMTKIFNQESAASTGVRRETAFTPSSGRGQQWSSPSRRIPTQAASTLTGWFTAQCFFEQADNMSPTCGRRWVGQ